MTDSQEGKTNRDGPGRSLRRKSNGNSEGKLHLSSQVGDEGTSRFFDFDYSTTYLPLYGAGESY